MEIQNCETLSNNVKVLCENLLKFIATLEFKEVCDNTVSKIIEILKNVNLTKCGDQEEFQIDIHQMVLNNGFQHCFITGNLAVTKPEVVSLFLCTLLQEYMTYMIKEGNMRRESGQTKALDDFSTQ